MSDIIGVTCGSFDLTHAGHYLMFKECKEHCDYLIVCLQTDPTIDRTYKNKPIQGIKERLIQLESCKYIDQIVIYSTEDELYDILAGLPIDVRIIGEDWKGKNFTGDDLPIAVVYNSRKHDFSTTSLRERVYKAERNRFLTECNIVGNLLKTGKYG